MDKQKELTTRLKAIQQRQGLSRSGLAKYYSVPDQTIYKWLDGERYPNAATLRLIDDMETIEILAPGIHDSLVSMCYKVHGDKS